ncbi:MAG: stage II sporulation protein M [Oscillospiraceae bacterium]|nr:stage II sporulation protein M [Oscillospiraceae bacterium]
MNGRKVAVQNRAVPSEERSGALFLLAGFFLVGGLLGCLLASRVGGGANDSLSSYIKGYLTAVHTGEANSPGIFPVLWENFRYPVACVVLGVTSAGAVMVPIVFAVRGFFLSFAVSSFVCMFGGRGLLMAAGVFLPAGLVVIPCMFLLGILMLRPTGKITMRGCLPAFGVCAGALLLITLYECLLAPKILGLLASVLLQGS